MYCILSSKRWGSKAIQSGWQLTESCSCWELYWVLKVEPKLKISLEVLKMRLFGNLECLGMSILQMLFLIWQSLWRREAARWISLAPIVDNWMVQAKPPTRLLKIHRRITGFQTRIVFEPWPALALHFWSLLTFNILHVLIVVDVTPQAASICRMQTYFPYSFR